MSSIQRSRRQEIRITRPGCVSQNTQYPEIALEIRLSDKDSRRLYEEIYTSTDIALSDSFYLWLINLFNLREIDIYLDISCGHGQLTALARQHGVSAYGLDLSLMSLKTARASARHYLTVGDSQNLPYGDDRFTVVSCIGSLEHYVNMQAAIAEMARVLKPGGRAFVLVPNTFSLLHNIWVAFRQGRTNIDEQPIQRYMARREWQKLIETKGLVVDKTIKYEIEIPRTGADLLNLLGHPKRMLRLLVAPLVPLNLAFCFVFICFKPR